MFVLRKVLQGGLQHNQAIGDNYQFVHRHEQYNEFKRAYKVVFGVDHVADLDELSDNFSKNCYGIITYNEGFKLIPLYKNQCNYIMSESGKTFENLTDK